MITNCGRAKAGWRTAPDLRWLLAATAWMAAGRYAVQIKGAGRRPPETTETRGEPGGYYRPWPRLRRSRRRGMPGRERESRHRRRHQSGKDLAAQRRPQPRD